MKLSTERSYLLLFVILAAVGLVADQTSKYIVFAKLYPADTERETVVPVIANYFSLRTIYSLQQDSGDGALSRLRTLSGDRLPEVNRGALFGIGNGDADSGGMNPFFAILSLLAACFIVFWTTRPNVAKDRFLCLALGLILGGTLGNLYDRIVFGGVRDFLNCYYDTHVWPDFNIADCCLVCGAGVLLAHSIFVSEPAPQAETSAPAGTPETAIAGAEAIAALNTTSATKSA